MRAGCAFPGCAATNAIPDIGIFGPYGVAGAHRKTGLGAALLDAALGSLRAKGYARGADSRRRRRAAHRHVYERTGARIADIVQL